MSASIVRDRGLAATATLVHDVSMRDVEKAAEAAVALRRRTLWLTPLDDSEMEEGAWHGIVEWLYACGCGQGTCTREDGVTFTDLVRAGTTELASLASQAVSHLGLSKTGTKTPSFLKFWLPPRKSKYHSGDGFSDQLCDRMALADALSVLTPEQYDVLAALAAFNNGREAAEALGLTYAAYDGRLRKARKKIAEVWVGDLPATPSEDTCRKGHSRAKHGRQVTEGKYLVWKCSECDRAKNRRAHRKRAGDRLAAAC